MALCDHCGNKFSPGDGIDSPMGLPNEFCSIDCYDKWRPEKQKDWDEE